MSCVLPFIVEGVGVRGALVVLEASWQACLNKRPPDQAYSPRLSQVLGEVTAATLLIRTMLPSHGERTNMVIQGRGLIRALVVDHFDQWHWRAMVNGLSDHPIDNTTSLKHLWNTDGKGLCQLTESFPFPQAPMQCMISLNNEKDENFEQVSDIFENFMNQSVQSPATFLLAANEHRATGMVLQAMPDKTALQASQTGTDLETPASAYERLSIMAKTLTSHELLTLEPTTLLHRLFWQDDVRILGLNDPAYRPAFRCTCSKSRCASFMRSLGIDEIRETFETLGCYDITCESCFERYSFTQAEAMALFDTTAS